MIGRLALNLAIAALPAIAFVSGAAQRTGISLGRFYKAFLAGLIVVVPAIAIMLLVSAAPAGVDGFLGEVVDAFVVAGLVEEAAKIASVAWSISLLSGTRPSAPGPPSRGEVGAISATAGLGFAFLENAFYVVGSSSLLLARALLAVPLHGATAVILGFAILPPQQAARPAPAAWPEPVTKAGGGRRAMMGLFVAVLIHGTYDLAVVQAVWLSPAVVLLAVAVALKFQADSEKPRSGRKS